MSVSAAYPVDLAPRGFDRLRAWLTDVWVMTRRNLIHVRREPMQLTDVTVQPVLFTLMFVYVFGSAMVLPGGGAYKDFVIAGLLCLNLIMSAPGTAVGLASDVSTGVIDRLHTLPMSPTSILVGRSLSDLLAAVICSAIVALTGLAIGWHATTSLLQVLAGFGVVLLFSYAFHWMAACLGLAVSGPESAEGIAFIAMIPLAFVSNVLVPAQGMPAWLRTIAIWNPVSAVASACRELFGNPNPSALLHAWPMQHPVAASLIWSLAILAVCVPLAGHLYRRKTRR